MLLKPSMSEEVTQDTIKQTMQKNATTNQYGLSKVPFHTHNSSDSPPINPNNVIGNLQTTKSPVNIGRSVPPTTGQTLVATSPTTATWQAASSGVSQDWQFSGLFSALNSTTVQWTSGTLLSLDGTSYSISAGNTGAMSQLTYIYFDKAVSITALQVTTTPATAVGTGKVLIGVALNGALNPQGNTIFTDNFDSYMVGALNGQGSWTDTDGAFNVQTSVVEAGVNALISTNAFHTIELSASKSGTLLGDGSWTIYVNIGAASSGGGVIYLQEGATVIVKLAFFDSGTTTGVFQYSGTTTFGPVLNNGTWYAITVQWRSLDKMVRYGIDGANWTGWVAPFAGWTTGMDTVVLLREPFSPTVYWDTIQQNPTYSAATFQIFGGSGGLLIDSSSISNGASGTFVDKNSNKITVNNGIITDLNS